MLMRVFHALRYRGINFFGKAALRRKGVKLGIGVGLNGLPIVTLAKGSVIELGQKVKLCSESHSTGLGVSRPVILRTLRPGARISIGSNSGLSGTVICAAVEVVIGAECLFGADVTIADTDFHAIKAQGRRNNTNPADIAASPISIADNVFIGTGAFILKGVSIGKNSIIGAGSVVTQNVPENVVAAGNPARVIKKIENPK